MAGVERMQNARNWVHVAQSRRQWRGERRSRERDEAEHSTNAKKSAQRDHRYNPCPGFTSFSSIALAGSRIIWATGYTQDYRWLKADVLDANGRPQHQRGVTNEYGVYFLGLPWQSRRGSSFIWGVWHDAKYIADQIEIQRNYQAYTPA